MALFHYMVVVDTDTQENADTVVGARLGCDEDYGFDYTVDYEKYADWRRREG